jgi:hypothetical protein
MLLEVPVSVTFLEKFPFVMRHHTELADVGSRTPFLVSCTNTALPNGMLSLGMFTLHNFHEGMFPHITR